MRQVPAAALASLGYAALVWGPFLIAVLSFETGAMQGAVQSAATAGVVPAPAVLYPLHSQRCAAGWVAWATALALAARAATRRVARFQDP